MSILKCIIYEHFDRLSHYICISFLLTSGSSFIISLKKIIENTDYIMKMGFSESVVYSLECRKELLGERLLVKRFP